MRLTLPRLNQVILLIIFAEFMFATGTAIVAPIFAVFVLENVAGAAFTVVGFAISIYWITKSILQLPIARYLDRNHGEIDDYYSMLAGTALITAGIFAYYFVTEVWHVYALQVLIATGDAFVVPPFYAIFTRHLDPDSTGFEWSMRSSFSLGAGSAIGGALSGIIAAAVGTRAIFLFNGAFMAVGFLVLFLLKPYIRPKAPRPAERIFIEQKRL